VADVLPGLLVLDAGIGLAASAIFITAMAGVGEAEAGMVSGLTTMAHELGIAFVLPVLSTIAAGSELLPSGLGDAFRAAALLAFGSALLPLVWLRRSDVTAPAQPALAGH
jgi:hypothetical protein